MERLHSLPHARKILLSIYLPVLTVTLLSCFAFVYSHHRANYEQLYVNVEQITEQVAEASEYPLLFDDRTLLMKNIRNLLSHKSIVGVQYFDGLERPVEFAGLTPDNGSFSPNIETTLLDRERIFVTSAPIYYTVKPSDSLMGFQAEGPAKIVGWMQVTANYAQIELENLRYTLIALVLLCALNAVIFYFVRLMSVRLSAPLDSVQHAIVQIYEENYGYSKRLRLGDEFADLTKALVYMDGRLEKYQQDIDQQVEQLTQDAQGFGQILEEKNIQLRFAKEAAAKASRLKSEFLANLSHEVRTPLNAILGFTDVLRNSSLSPDQAAHVETIQLSTQRLLTTINDILDYAKLESGKLQLEYREFNLQALINEVFHSLSAIVMNESKQIELVCDYDSDTPLWIMGDDVRFRQILMNLVGNAIKFTTSGHIRVIVSSPTRKAKRMTLLLQIQDTGIGIPEDKIDLLFKPFSQVDAKTTREFGGTGLGLVICKKLINQMKGDITISSKVGAGTNFQCQFDVPISPRDHQPVPTISRHILILEPARVCHPSLKRTLNKIGVTYHVFTHVADLLQAAQTPQRTPIDALLISYSSGITSPEDLNSLAVYCHTALKIPTILMGYATSPHLSRDFLRHYVSVFLNKPFDSESLKNALENCVLPTLEHNTQIKLSSPPLSPSQAPTQNAATSRLSQLHILAVDDTQVNLHLIQHWLAPTGIKLDFAYDGENAIQMAKDHHYDFILMDIQMPRMNGILATEAIRQIPHHQETPIIALTAHALGDEKKRILASGMNAYLSKPVSENTLIETIEHWCFSGETHQQVVFRALEGIFDYEKALVKTNQNIELAEDLFNMMVKELPKDMSIIKTHFDEKSLDELIGAVHRLHGASKYTGTVGITKHANFLETHLKEFEFFDVEGVYEDFLDAIAEFEQSIELIKWPQRSQMPERSPVHPSGSNAI